MAFASIPDAWIQVAQAITQRLWQRAKDNFDSLFGLVGSVQGFDILNGFFEIVEDLLATPLRPLSWDVTEYLGGTVELDDTESIKGTYGFKFNHPGGVGNGGGEAKSDYHAVNQIHSNPRLQVLYKSSLAGVHLTVKVEYFTAAKLFISVETLLDLVGGVPASYTDLNVTPTVPATARFLKVYIIGGDTDTDPGASADIVFDDISFVALVSGSVNETAMKDASISRAKLKTSTEDELTSSTDQTVIFASAADYGLFPSIKSSAGSSARLFNQAAQSTSTSFVTVIHIGIDSGSVTARMRYVTASGDVFWIWILRDKITKEILRVHTAPDHPAMTTGDPETMPHPYPGFDETIHEIVCITSSKKNGKYGKVIDDIHKAARHNNKAISEIVFEDYEIDEISDPVWPDDDVTVGYDLDDDDDLMDLYHRGSDKEIRLKKVKIPKPSSITHKGLRKKVKA